MKFLCDEMLQRLGSWLRAAGYDTLIEQTSEDDYSLLKLAISEDRILLTCDKELMGLRKAYQYARLLSCDSLTDSVTSLTRQVPVNWLYRPFSRCLKCNTELTRATQQQQDTALDKPSELTEAERRTARYCPTCQKVYWDGSHVTRMRHKLESWQSQR